MGGSGVGTDFDLPGRRKSVSRIGRKRSAGDLNVGSEEESACTS